MTQKPSMTRSGFDARQSTLRSKLKTRLDKVEPIGMPSTDTDVWDKVRAIGSKLVVTELRPIVKEHLGASFPVKFVQKGGYKSPEDVLDHLMPQLRNWCSADVDKFAEGNASGVTATPGVHWEAGDGR